MLEGHLLARLRFWGKEVLVDGGNSIDETFVIVSEIDFKENETGYLCIFLNSTRNEY